MLGRTPMTTKGNYLVKVSKVFSLEFYLILLKETAYNSTLFHRVKIFTR